MNGEVLTAWSQSARTRYERLLITLKDALLRVSVNSTPGTEQARLALGAELYALADSWLAEEAPIMRREIFAIGLDGVRETDLAVRMPASGTPETPEDLDEGLTAHLEDLVEDLDLSLRVQVERDIATVMRCLRDMALTGALRQRRGGANDTRGRGAAVNATGALEALSFDFLDRSGRRWTSVRHFGVLWRHALLMAWNEAALLRASQIGLPALMVDHPDASYGDRGLLVSADDIETTLDGEDVGLWVDIRDQVFHPNSVAWLRPVDAAISQA